MIVTPYELRARPNLVRELRAHPGEHVERRFAPLTRIETRASDDAGFVIVGLAAVFDELSVNLGGFRERIDRGAFRKVLANKPDTRCLFNHDMNYVLGRTTAGTLRLAEKPKGLEYDADAPDTSYARDLRVLLERGDVNQSSFAFRVARGGDTWEEDDETGVLIRTIHEFSDLYDVSPVTDPAYPQTSAVARGAGRVDTTTDVPSGDKQQDVKAEAPELDGQGTPDDARSTDTGTEPLQGDQDYLIAARQRRLRQLQRIAGR